MPHILSFASIVYLILPLFSQPPFLIPFISSLFIFAINKGIVFWTLLGTTFWTFNLVWIINSLKIIGFPLIFGIPLLLLSSLFLTFVSFVPLKIIYNKIRTITKIKIPTSFYIPSIFSVLEFFRFFIFPWAPFGLMFIKTPIAQIAEIIGIHGLSFVSIFIGCLIFDTRKNKKYLVIPFVFASILWILGLVIENRSSKITENGGLKFLSLRSNISREQKWTNVEEAVEKMLAYINTDSDLIVLPETAISIPFRIFKKNHPALTQIIEDISNSSVIIFGSIESYGIDELEEAANVERGEEFLKRVKIEQFNSGFVMLHKKIIMTQRKRILIPFAEKPLFLKFLKNLQSKKLMIGSFKEGKETKILKMFDRNLSIFICWEILFSSLVRKAVSKGANILVNISNDYWFHSFTSMQQIYYSTLIAIENRVWIIRSSNAGPSAVISPEGKIIKMRNTPGTITGEIPQFEQRKTFFTKMGDVFSIINLFYIAFFFLFVKIKYK